MRLPCWLAGHAPSAQHTIIERLDGYPIGSYRRCVVCGKRVGTVAWSEQHAPPLDVAKVSARGNSDVRECRPGCKPEGGCHWHCRKAWP